MRASSLRRRLRPRCKRGRRQQREDQYHRARWQSDKTVEDTAPGLWIGRTHAGAEIVQVPRRVVKVLAERQNRTRGRTCQPCQLQIAPNQSAISWMGSDRVTTPARTAAPGIP
jgi:hypothetical protein